MTDKEPKRTSIGLTEPIRRDLAIYRERNGFDSYEEIIIDEILREE